MHRGKGMKFVGDSRITAVKTPNIPKDYSEYPGKTEAFWPNFLLKEWMVGAVFLVGFLALCVAHDPPLEKMADPAAVGYIPLPDWYFLFLYQLLKYTYASGPYNVIGAMVMPGLAFGALLLAPFIDRGPERRPFKRPFATGFMLLSVISIFYLTWASVDMHDWEAAKKQGEIVLGPEIDQEDPGYAVYEASGCIGCHGGNLEGGPGAPTLAGTGLTAEEIAEIAVNGTGSMPAGLYKGTDEDLQLLSEFIAGIEAE
ncbi:c-type cytochrome [Bacillus sp. AGMB 02131]|uniref:Menaquinol:cytochrome c reductase cytochrome c subunit n=1 Tax=Peribacillus faecalis TaxID=2772559 RepID=A0A927HC31_9BACI|nr:menaquinol-cytochrome c reductase cytochrome b/c subunit [Peribacillus faecalis]MBD3110405.1 c-type cytochrome [Peribacillus faecalis]